MQELPEIIKKDEVKFLELQFTDMLANIKSVDVPASQLEDIIENGIWFDGSSIEGFARIMESDMYLRIIPETYAVIPWSKDNKKTARFLCSVYSPDGKPFEEDPRNILEKQLYTIKEKNLEFNVGPEVEFYLLEKDERGISIPQDHASYFDSSTKDLAMNVRKDIMSVLESFGIHSERGHHEVGPGQHEIGFQYSDALTAADNVITLKQVVRSIASDYNLIATFMPKRQVDKPGNGMHVNFSLFQEKTNLFYDQDRRYSLSETAEHFIAGIITHIKEISLLLNPTVNSYKRLGAFEAPSRICWGDRNRSALIRVPRFSKGKKESTRAEIRNPDPSCNPYLAFSAVLVAGMDGMENRTELIAPITGNAFDNRFEEKHGEIARLPSSLEEAIHHFRNSQLMKDLLGDNLFDKYLTAKEMEWQDYTRNISQWEVEKYLETC